MFIVTHLGIEADRVMALRPHHGLSGGCGSFLLLRELVERLRAFVLPQEAIKISNLRHWMHNIVKGKENKATVFV